MRRKFLIALIATLMFKVHSAKAQSFVGDTIRLTPQALPTTCNTGDLKFELSSSTYKFCVSNVWTSLGGGGSAAQAGTASYAGTAGFAGTASFAQVAGTASIATAFSTVPSACAAGVWANAIGPNGNLTCATVTTANQAGTAAFATSSNTASTSGTAAFAAVAGTASVATSSSTPNPTYSPNQFGVMTSGLANTSMTVVAPTVLAWPLVSGGTGGNPSYSVLAVLGGGTGMTAGTSGGVPYFASATAMAASGVMSAGGVMLGGGAGSSPTSFVGTTAGQVLTWTGSTWNASAGSSGGGQVTTALTQQVFTTVSAITGYYFNILSGTISVGANYSNNVHTYSVVNAVTCSSSCALYATNNTGTAASVPNTTGSLVFVSGAGTGTVGFSSAQPFGTYTASSSTLAWIRIRLIGGGGGSGGNGLTISMGAGGNGQPSFFGPGTLFGGGGTGGTNVNGGVSTGGICSAGQIQIQGGNGGSLEYIQGTFSTAAGAGLAGVPGGNGVFGGGGPMGGSNGSAGVPGAANTGGGASSPAGSQNPAGTGGGGGAGGYCESIVSAPGSTYIYGVGSGGGGGASGNNGNQTGSQGGSGIVIVEEHYNY